MLGSMRPRRAPKSTSNVRVAGDPVCACPREDLDEAVLHMLRSPRDSNLTWNATNQQLWLLPLAAIVVAASVVGRTGPASDSSSAKCTVTESTVRFIGVVQNDREELVVHAFGAGPARHNCSTKQVGRYDDDALQQQHGGRPEGRTHRFRPLEASPTAPTALQQPGQRHRDRAKIARKGDVGDGVHFQLSRVKFPATVSLFPLADHQISRSFQGNLRVFLSQRRPCREKIRINNNR